MRALPLLLSLLLTIGAAHAEISTIDFNSPPLSCYASYTSSGITFTNSRGTICAKNDTDGLKLVHVHGMPFTLISARLAQYSMTVPATKPIVFTGTKSGGETVSFSVELPKPASGSTALSYTTFAFPPSFADVLSVETSGDRFTVDNVTISGVVPPALPENQKRAPGFIRASLLRTQSVHANHFVIGPDFGYAAGFRPPTEGHVLLGGSSSLFQNKLGQASYDDTSGTLVFVNDRHIRSFDGENLETWVSPQDMEDLGFAGNFSNPILTGSALFFCVTFLNGDENYGIFRSSGGGIEPLVTPETQLPGANATGPPYHFPDSLAAWNDSYAFDSSIEGSSGTRRIFASFDKGPLQLIVSEGDSTPYGALTGFGEIAFKSSRRLEVIGHVGLSTYRLLYEGLDLVSVTPQWFLIHPINEGRSVFGSLRSNEGDPVQLFADDSGIYRRSGNDWFCVIQIGDSINGEPITSLRYFTTRRETPYQTIVEVRVPSSSLAQHYQLTLAEPVEHPPKLGRTLVHHESGDLYMELSQLTKGRDYWLSTSDDLENWEPLWPVPEILPIQHLRVPAAELKSHTFFRVEEIDP